MLIIENKEKRAELLPVSWGQKQITESSYLLVFTRVLNIWKNLIDNFLDSNCKITWATREQLKWYENMMKWFALSLTDETEKLWLHEQVSIALWNILTVLAMKKIDSCAIWWFIHEKYDEILWLKEKWLSSVVVLPIWYRKEGEKYSSKSKVRFSTEEICDII